MERVFLKQNKAFLTELRFSMVNIMSLVEKIPRLNMLSENNSEVLQKVQFFIEAAAKSRK